MDETKQVVNLAVEATPQIDRNPEPVIDVVPQAEPALQETPDPIPLPIPAAPPAYEAVDEFGVPWKNRAMELKRKNEEVIERLPQLIEEKLKSVTQPQQPVYTYEQLEAFKLQNVQNSEAVSWATAEQRKITAAENRLLFEEVQGAREQVNKVEMAKQQSLQYVQNTYPEAFKRDAQGNPLTWDEASPITQHIFGLMKSSELANNPRGLAAAADIAYGRVARSQTPILQKQVQQAKADVKQVQKASLTEGAGRRVTTLADQPQQTALNNLKKTGSLQDATTAIGTILRQKGILVE